MITGMPWYAVCVYWRCMEFISCICLLYHTMFIHIYVVYIYRIRSGGEIIDNESTFQNINIIYLFIYYHSHLPFKLICHTIHIYGVVIVYVYSLYVYCEHIDIDL